MIWTLTLMAHKFVKRLSAIDRAHPADTRHRPSSLRRETKESEGRGGPREGAGSDGQLKSETVADRRRISREFSRR